MKVVDGMDWSGSWLLEEQKWLLDPLVVCEIFLKIVLTQKNFLSFG